jgi:tetratricopeptide (TPR) repeat protein
MKKSRLVIIAFFFLCAVLYLENMAPSFNSDDSPETTLAYCTLGIQHPPGYPLASLIGKIFTLIPLGGVSFRANIAAAALNILAAFVLYLLAALVFGKAIKKRDDGLIQAAALAAAAIFVFSSSAWLQGSIAKGSIYSLNSLLLCAGLYSLFKIGESAKYFYLFALLYGLSMCNHWASMIVIAPAVIYYIVMKRKTLKPGNYWPAALFFMLGLSAYLYVPLRNASNPVYAWGDVRSFKDFLWLVSRAQYSGAEVRHNFADTAALLKFYLKNLFTFEYPWFIAAVVIPGAAALAYFLPAEGGALLMAFIMLVFGVASFATPPPDTQWITKPYLVSANVFAGISGAFIIFYFINYIKRKNTRTVVSFGVLTLMVCSLVFTGRPDYSEYFIGYDYANNLVKSLTPGCVYFAEGDMNVGAALYKTLIDRENFAPVIPVVSLYPWYERRLARNYGRIINVPPPESNTKAYISDMMTWNSGRDFFYSNVFTKDMVNPAEFVPDGIVYGINTGSGKPVISDYYLKLYSWRGIIGDRIRYDEFTRRLVVENYAMAFFNLGDVLRSAGNNRLSALFYEKGLFFYKNHGAYINAGLAYYMSGNLDKALYMWQKAMDDGPDDPSVYCNMAFVYAARKDYPLAGEFIKKALSLDPGNSTAIGLSEAIKKLERPK